MGRHSKTEVLQPVSDLTAGKFEGMLTPIGDDGANMPTELIPTVGVSIPKHATFEQIAPEHISPAEVGLGRGAVYTALHLAEQRVKDADFSDAKEGEQAQEAFLEQAREQLKEVSRKRTRGLRRLLREQPPSPWLDTQLKLKRSGNSIVKRLTKKNRQGGYKVPDELFLNFLEWHNHALAERQKIVDRRANQDKRDYLERLYIAADNGWVAPSLDENVERVAGADIVVDDGIMTDLDDAQGKAERQSNHNAAILSPLLKESEVAFVIDHELTHIGEGVDKKDVAKLFKMVMGESEKPKRLHGLERIFGNKGGGRALNEATVEHFTSSLHSGDIDITRPGHKVRREATYEDERWLLHGLCSYGVKKIDVRLFIDALFENRESALDEENSIGDLKQELKEAFPFADVIDEIRALKGSRDGKGLDYYEKYAKKLRRRKRMYKLGQFVMPRK